MTEQIFKYSVEICQLARLHLIIYKDWFSKNNILVEMVQDTYDWNEGDYIEDDIVIRLKLPKEEAVKMAKAILEAFEEND